MVLLISMLIFHGFYLIKLRVTGKAGWAAPRLKDASLSLDKLRECYVEVRPCVKHLSDYLNLVKRI